MKNTIKKPSWWEEFTAFAVKGNAMALAVGTIIGAAFSTITKSLTDDIIMPIIAIFMGGIDFSEMKIVLPRLFGQPVLDEAGNEILIPSMNGYKEVSSVSNARDYQARRGNCRFRRADGKIDFVHTLNGSGLATSRIFPAIVEQNQRADGSIVVPEVLRKYLGGIEVIEPKK